MERLPCRNTGSNGSTLRHNLSQRARLAKYSPYASTTGQLGRVVQSNKVYPPRGGALGFYNVGRAADKRYSLGLKEHPVRAIELKIPPPLVALLVAVAMWGISVATSRFEISAVIRDTVVGAIAMVGVGIAVVGVLAFRRARTTINPLKPEATSSLVTSGVYRFTRNPMYLGLSLVLFAWALFLSAALAFLGPVAFVLYISRFQIVPEERVLSKLFGPVFADYQSKVRRWL